jgi:hypothetical protein
MAVSFWMMGNNQMFNYSDIETINFIDQTYFKSHHLLGDVFARILMFKLSRPETLFLIGFISYLFVYIAINFIKPIHKFLFDYDQKKIENMIKEMD